MNIFAVERKAVDRSNVHHGHCVPPAHEEFSVSDDFRLENYNLAHGVIHNWLGTSPGHGKSPVIICYNVLYNHLYNFFR